MKSTLKKILFGDTIVTEYSKIRVPGEIQERVYLELGDRLIDISQHHYILCIEPLIFGAWIDSDVLPAPIAGKTGYRLYFCDGPREDSGEVKRSAIAIASLEMAGHIEEKGGSLLLLRLQKSSIHHFNYIKTQLLFSRYYKKEGMSFARFSGFVSAYSYPRRIRLVSFRQGNYYNLFPMDLLGDINHVNRYVFGLRHTNVTLTRILETGRLVVAEIPFEHKDAIYQLARHHSGSPPALDALPFGVVQTRHFGFYLPEWATSYKEVNILKTMNIGSHMLMWGVTAGETVLHEPTRPLFLLHFLAYFHQKLNGLGYPLV